MRILYPTYYDENAATAFPFAATATRTNGDVTFTAGVFVDGRIFPPNSQGPVYISSVVVSANVVVTLADDTGPLGSAAFDPNAVPEYLSFTSPEGVFLGILQGRGDSIKALSTWPVGEYTFDADQTAFAPTVIMPQPQQCVRAFQLESGAIFTGAVTFVGENGVQVEYDDATQQLVRVDIVGDPLYTRTTCATADKASPYGTPLQSLRFNGATIGPDDDGGVQLVLAFAPGAAKPALRITQIENGLEIGFAHG